MSNDFRPIVAALLSALVFPALVFAQSANVKTPNTNQSTKFKSIIVKGAGNIIRSNSVASFIGGGQSNTISLGVTNAVIGGGLGNLAGDQFTTIAGGWANKATGFNSTVGGGNENAAPSQYAVIGGGLQNTAGIPGNPYATVGGGVLNSVTGIAGTVAGGSQNMAGADNAAIGGGSQNTNGGYAGFIGGGSLNKIEPLVSNAVVVGGIGNRALTNFAIVGGGERNRADGDNSLVVGGGDNVASGSYAVVGGGSQNFAGGSSSTVGGGLQNDATALYCTVPGGVGARATNTGSFVWSGDSTEFTDSFDNFSFTVRAEGGVRFYTGNGNAIGVGVGAGGTSWASLSDSNSKTDVKVIKPREILSKVAALPVTSWHYKHDLHRRYIGPMAQDFHAAFGLGSDDKTISTLDSDGVMYAAIQGLVEELKDRDAKIAGLESKIGELDVLKAKFEELQKHLDNLPPKP